jgi:DNA-binding MarR family transcriptional regulator
MSKHLGPPPIGFLLRLAAGAHRNKLDQLLADVQITAPQFFILTLLAREPGLSIADLARRTGQRMPTLSTILANLRSRDIVTATPHATHGRIRQLTLTQQGYALHAQCDARAALVEAELVDMPMEQIETVRRWLERTIDKAGMTEQTSE